MADLPPGPKLDALVAEAMGWEWKHSFTGKLWRGPGKRRAGDWKTHPPAFSTTGDGMLAMMEWVTATERQWDIKVYAEFSPFLSKRWHACIKTKKREFWSYTDAAPHAVALVVSWAGKAEKDKP